MTDIVFLLLIFFMLTSTLVTVNAIDVLLPKAAGKTENKQTIVVSITKNDAFFIGSDPVEKTQLEAAILSRIKNNNQAQNHMVIRGDQQVSYKHIVYVMDIANRNKIKMILAVGGQ